MSDPSIPPNSGAALRGDNLRMLGKLAVVATLMFGFGYALVPMYRAICTALGVNVLALAELQTSGEKDYDSKNTQVDLTRTITVDAGQVTG